MQALLYCRQSHLDLLTGRTGGSHREDPNHRGKIVIHSVRQFPWKQPLLRDWTFPGSLSQDTLLSFSVDRSSFEWFPWRGQFRILLKAAPTSALRTGGRVAFTNS